MMVTVGCTVYDPFYQGCLSYVVGVAVTLVFLQLLAFHLH